MDGRAIRGKTLFAAAVLGASLLILAFKLINPTPIQLLVEGDTVIMSQVPGLFTYTDVLVIGVALVLISVSGTYLILHDSRTPTLATSTTSGDVLLEERRQRWEEVAKVLKDNEQIIYKAVIDDGIINQSELADRTGLSKSNVSRALYGLESRGLVERRRQGMGNVVLLR